MWRIVRSLARDGRDQAGSAGSFSVKRIDAEVSRLTLNRGWTTIESSAQLRRDAASRLLEHLITCLPAASRGKDLLAQTTLGKLRAALAEDLLISSRVRDLEKLLDRALLWLHEQEIVRLNKGLAVFRPAMTIHLAQPRRGFSNIDFAPLKLHYDEQVVQIHVMAEYVQRGLEAMADALRLAMDYFNLPREVFLRRWLTNRERELSRQSTPRSWHSIVEALGNPDQQRIVADDRERTNVLVLAGPGSGKTRVLVHRIAYLLRVRRERARGILALAYNRHAAAQIRRRLTELIGDDARGVTVMTCHALAMRLTGSSFEHKLQANDAWFDQVMQQAIALLEGEDLAPEDADEQRARLLGGFRWILVDEYQDIEAAQYALISALAGRRREDADGQLTLFAVGDDDQNIYAFAGASVEFIRRFEADYDARPAYLVENYRSTTNIIAAANAMIAPASERMKSDHPIVIDRRRRDDPTGGQWQARDPVARGRVQILPAGTDMMSQAIAVMSEFQRLASLAPDWDWSRVAVIARQWRCLDPVQAWCELHAVPAQRADESLPQFWRVRETQMLLDWLRQPEQTLVDAARLHSWLEGQSMSPWFDLLREAVAEYAVEIVDAELPREHFIEWLAEWGREARRRITGLLLSSAHAAKGFEFDHVAVLDGGWSTGTRDEDPDAERRLYYVAMTRAKHTLLLARISGGHALLDALGENPALLQRAPMRIAAAPAALTRRYLRLSLRDVDLGFSGRLVPANPVHRAIGALQPGDPLTLRSNGRALELLDGRGTVVGRLARSFEPPRDMQVFRARVAAIVRRRHDDGRHDPDYADRSRCDAWEVVVPDLVYVSTQQAAAE